MFCTVINDCLDPNAVGRQGSRIASLLGVGPTFVGVGGTLSHDNEFDAAELEAAGCLIDVLDATEGREGLVLVNIANRHGKGKRWENGTPFGYFWHGKTIIVSSIDGCVLSLAKKVGVLNEISVMDVGVVMKYLASEGVVSDEIALHVSRTQFRSFDFTPRVGAFLLSQVEVPSTVTVLESANFMVDIPASVWFVDNFGNVKTTILPEEIGFQVGLKIMTRYGEISCYERLKDVPNNEAALIVGSSGIGVHRFVEFVVQGKSCAQVYDIKVGDQIFE